MTEKEEIGCGGNVLNFETAMAHFTAMFPDLSCQMIESVLRKHDGNVAETIEELLARSAEIACAPSSSSSPSSSSVQLSKGDEMRKNSADSEKGIQKVDKNGKTPQQQRDPCADDEKIALLIQNREFLRYLRHDPHFQRAVIGQHQASARHANHYPLPSGPKLLTSSRLLRSPHTNRLFGHVGSDREQPQMVPDGPMLPFLDTKHELAIPDGPLIDYMDAENRESGLAGRIKAKLSKRPPEGSEMLPPSPVVHFTDEQMRKGIHGVLAAGGKGWLERLARKFALAKSQNYKSGRVRMEEEEEEEEEEEADEKRRECGGVNGGRGGGRR